MNLPKKLLIPAELSRYILSDPRSRLPLFRMLFCMKFIFKPKFRLYEHNTRQLRERLGYKSNKTIHTNIGKLVEMNLLGFDPKFEIYFQRKIEEIAERADLLFYKSTHLELRDLDRFTAFLGGLVICSFCQTTTVKNYKKNREIFNRVYEVRPISGGRKQTSYGHDLWVRIDHYFSIGYWPISSQGLAKRINCSVSFAQTLKKMAEKEGFVKVVKMQLKLPISSSQYPFLLKYVSPLGLRVRSEDGMLMRDMPDLVLPLMRLKFRRFRNFKIH